MEGKTIEVCSTNTKKNKLTVVLEHVPRGYRHSVVQFTLEIWSYNQPIMLMRHKTKNIWRDKIVDAKLYNIMDFDIGGPRSYKDDYGEYDIQSSVMTLYDNNPLCVCMTSRPKPHRWDILPPAKIKIDENRRDLNNGVSLGPKDVASALQWDLGNLEPGDERSVEMVVVASGTRENSSELLEKAWELFDKKMQ